MDDLAGLDWSKDSSRQTVTNPQQQSSSFSLTPASSGHSTPLSSFPTTRSIGATKGPSTGSKPSTPANDSFSNLLGATYNKTSSGNNLSLQERQRLLIEEKARKQSQQHGPSGTGTNVQDAAFWESLGATRSANAPTQNYAASGTVDTPYHKRPDQNNTTDDDLFAAFNANTKVDSSSHFPPPANATLPNDDDDDPFGLNSIPQASNPKTQPALPEQDDDILGMLGRPVSEMPPKPPTSMKKSQNKEAEAESTSSPSDSELDPRDKAVAELVDMGFSADKAAAALARTESGTNVQAAVGIILNEAHQEANQKSRQSRRRDDEQYREEVSTSRSQSRSNPAGRHPRADSPAWMQEHGGRSGSQSRQEANRSGDKDVAQYASELGSSLFKSANSLWKTGQKKVQKAVADFQQEGDPNQPKWMRSATPQSMPVSRSGSPSVDALNQRSNARGQSTANMTAEAMLLEGGGGRPNNALKTSNTPRTSSPLNSLAREDMKDNNRRPSEKASVPRFSDVPAQPQGSASQISRITRQQAEEHAAQAYVSPARRKKTTPLHTAEADLFTQNPTPAGNLSRNAELHPNNPFASRPTPSRSSSAPKSTPIPVRPKAPPRQIHPISQNILSQSAAHRQKGSEAFKRGDYAEAESAYSSALAQIPHSHPIAVIILCNRALTHIKVGNPKAAVSDAETALSTIGPSRGQDEKIQMGGMEPDKDMKEFYGKALMRKAEALEHMEKWSDAGKVWKEAIEAGVGGAVSQQGRTRCERALGKGKQAQSAPKKPAVRPQKPRQSALQDLGGSTGAETEAVKQLRAANAAAAKADDEKFALTDSVDAKLVEWKGTKADNLRALLGSLDKVLWPEAGWNKVGMGDLVAPNRVKIIYMKAIAKVHPDKLSQTATTEQKMISAAVFATLNEAWDKFKKDNGL
jgi:hypothetical protein